MSRVGRGRTTGDYLDDDPDWLDAGAPDGYGFVAGPAVDAVRRSLALHEISMILFTADTHFDDPRILRIDRRPFRDLASHDEALIEQWNSVVGHDDEVWHLGDFASGTIEFKEALLARLNGRKHLIVGNNDDAATTESRGWASVQAYRELVVDDTRLILCHYAFRTWNGMGKGSIDLHGHSHGRLKTMPRQYDVGVDAFRYRPVTLAEILDSRRKPAGWNSVADSETVSSS